MRVREHILLVALSTDAQQRFTTIAVFISGMRKQAVPWFFEVLLASSICNPSKYNLYPLLIPL